MSNTNLQTVFEARRKAQEELRSLYATAGDNRLTAEQAQTESRLAAAIEDYQKREANLIAMDAEQRSADSAAASFAQRSGGNLRPAASNDELRQLVSGELRSIELRDAVTLNTGTASDGAEVVPTTLHGRVVDSAQELSPYRQAGAMIIQTPGGEDYVIPRNVSHSAASIVAEGAVIGDDAPQFDTVTLGSYKYGFLIPVSTELEQDEAVAIVRDQIMPQGREALERGFGAHWASGTGTDQPTGVDNCTVGVTAASATAITLDELYELYHAPIAEYRQNGVWLMSDATLLAVRKLKDADLRPLWQPGLTLGAPDTLLGRPVVTSPDIADMATGSIAIVFGDFSRGSVVRLAGPARIERSVDYAFDTDTITYRFVQRADSDILIPGALRSLQMA